MCLSPLLLFIACVLSVNVTTLAGDGTFADRDGLRTYAQFSSPNKIATNASGFLIVSSFSGCKIRVISPSGYVSTLAGGNQCGRQDGTGTGAFFDSPAGVCIDQAGNVFVTDFNNNNVRKVTPNGVVTTFAGDVNGGSGYSNGLGTAARFYWPRDCTFDTNGTMYVIDTGNSPRVRKIAPDGTVTTLAGSSLGFNDGAGSTAQFNSLKGIAVAPSGDVYVADSNNHRIRKITQDGYVSTVAGNGNPGYTDGNATTAMFYYPYGITFSPSGDLYVTDFAGNCIRRVTMNGDVTTVVGSSSGFQDGDETNAMFKNPTGLVFNSSDTIFVADQNNARIRQVRISITNAIQTTTISTTAVSTTTRHHDHCYNCCHYRSNHES
ncbi:hypothetical protein EDD86DRAFT_140432 [Gorgonomyces haynaldii]|nr:hypothetical protein EDD86DRAFT_140432 [Gorgonomyces haynaldii]